MRTWATSYLVHSLNLLALRGGSGGGESEDGNDVWRESGTQFLLHCGRGSGLEGRGGRGMSSTRDVEGQGRARTKSARDDSYCNGNLLYDNLYWKPSVKVYHKASGYIEHRFHCCNYGNSIFCIFDNEIHVQTGWTQWCWKGRSSLRAGSRRRQRHWQSPGTVLTSYSLSGGWRKYALLDVSLTVIMNEITSVSWQSRITARCTPYAIYRLYARRVSSQATSAVARTCIQPPLPPRRTSLRFSSTESSTLL